MKKYNLSEIMHKAWKLYRKGTAAFAECLHRAWNSAKALLQVVLIHSSKGDGQTYRASFFGASQVKPLPHFQLAQTEARNAGLWLSVMLLESSPVLNEIHLIHEQENKAHRQN